ncbi:hypothetical protein BABINDRAFT_161527 [Babjeviella inositovora NRRL Y-12698]|uniref:tRNA (uracil-O(2)-)-methyltransferase n=1 Tax=Babjeviella inositovora NRRL Y-12698 TaxID=984486 RepID=A0A1E3QQ70_9ASCO|nr:uncharacterized protein BABINDRAFT_161527 [Babjeviella inositovora NRRL Y-12698]ODQ79849.1 hypothetical protein BABINDRAFT_161527 [Babjeviella inositovora NRRL Y-12698]
MVSKTFRSDVPNILQEESVLGPQWVGIFEAPVEFGAAHFLTAMNNLIREPNINSTIILRTDILKENKYHPAASFVSELVHTKPDIQSEKGEVLLQHNLDDVAFRTVPVAMLFEMDTEVVRRIIPRNPFKDYIINQTCLVLRQASDVDDSLLVVYVPHVEREEDIPFYLPPVTAVGILFHQGSLSVHYLPFGHVDPAVVAAMRALEHGARAIRIAYNLMQTAMKHSKGVKNGYAKRVNHDLVVSKVAFQDRYIALKKKYSLHLVENWAESTDPRKHVFEDIAIAAFLVELWAKIYPEGKTSFEYRDLGCGNGILVYLLASEGYTGIGMDARARKSWRTFPENIQNCLKEQVIVPSVLVRPHPAVKELAPLVTDNGQVFQVPFQDPNTNVPAVAFYSSASLLNNSSVDVAEYPANTFIIGNHSDELTCWIPLLGYPFMVIPCCSHALSGARIRYPPRKLDTAQKAEQQKNGTNSSSAYAALVDHVEAVAKQVGWKVEREMLRIPSTRNAAIIGYEKDKHDVKSVYDVLAMEGGAMGWVENTMALMKKPPRGH